MSTKQPIAGSVRAILLANLDYFTISNGGERRTVSGVQRLLRDNHDKNVGHSGVRAALDRMTADGVLRQSYQWGLGNSLVQHWEVATVVVPV
jgi:hypothetical protein